MKVNAYIYGCGNLFCKKYQGIKQHYNLKQILDNYKEGQMVMNEQEKIEITKPNYIDRQIPIMLMREDFIKAWRELRESGISNPILFSNTISPLTEIENTLFSNGQKVYEEKGGLWYTDSDGSCYRLNEYESIYTFMKNLERRRVRSDLIKELSVNPFNRNFGFSRGLPIDRWYIEKWLSRNSSYIKGDVMEIAEDTYTRRYGQDGSYKAHILNVTPMGEGIIVGNLETGEGISGDSIDCFILTQTLGFIYDFNSVLDNLYRMLRKGGVALITTGGISQISRYDMDRWGHYWWFTSLSLKKMIENSKFGKDYVMETYGNVKVACAMLYGMAAEELTADELEYQDNDYEVLHCLVLTKR